MLEGTEQVNESSENNLPSTKLEFMEEVESAINVPESLKIDTSHTLQCQPVLRSTSQCGADTEENHQQCPLQDQAEQDTEVCQDDDEYSAKGTIAEATSTQSEQLPTVFLPTNEVTIPIEKVGCILVTSHLQQFRDDYPPSTDKNAFLRCLPHAVIIRKCKKNQGDPLTFD